MDGLKYIIEHTTSERGLFGFILSHAEGCDFGTVTWTVRRYSEETRIWQLVEHKETVAKVKAALEEVRSAVSWWSLHWTDNGEVVSRVAKL